MNKSLKEFSDLELLAVQGNCYEDLQKVQQQIVQIQIEIARRIKEAEQKNEPR
jgi:hypothetical protein